MKTLHQAIMDNAGAQAPALLKHLNESGIQSWDDCTKINLADFRDHLCESVAPSSAKTYIATLKAVMNRYSEEGVIPFADFGSILKTRTDKPVKTYLTAEELSALERVQPMNENERFVLYSFLVSAYTGMRLSDCRQVSEENIEGGMLTYTSLKTGIQATVPCGELTKGYIDYVRANDSQMVLSTYNRIIRELCHRAGMTERVKIHKGGKDYVKEKWECVSSHTARISAATNLAIANVPLCDLRLLLGHTNIQMSERYIARHEVKLNEQAMAYFR